MDPSCKHTTQWGKKQEVEQACILVNSAKVKPKRSLWWSRTKGLRAESSADWEAASNSNTGIALHQTKAASRKLWNGVTMEEWSNNGRVKEGKKEVNFKRKHSSQWRHYDLRFLSPYSLIIWCENSMISDWIFHKICNVERYKHSIMIPHVYEGSSDWSTKRKKGNFYKQPSLTFILAAPIFWRSAGFRRYAIK